MSAEPKAKRQKRRSQLEMMEDAASALDCGSIGANARRTGARLVTTTPSAVSRRGGPLCANCCNPGARKACDHCAGVLYMWQCVRQGSLV